MLRGRKGPFWFIIGWAGVCAAFSSFVLLIWLLGS